MLIRKTTCAASQKAITLFICSFPFFWVCSLFAFIHVFLSKLWLAAVLLILILNVTPMVSNHTFESVGEAWDRNLHTEGPCSTTPNSSLWQVKDIHDFYGVHGDGLEHAAVTLVVHHHHEEIAAGNLLDHKGPASQSTDKQKRRWGRKRGERGKEECELHWQVDKVHGYDVNFHVCQGICVTSVYILPWQRGDAVKRLCWTHVKKMTGLTTSCQ